MVRQGRSGFNFFSVEHQMGNVRWDDFFFGEAGFEGVLPLIVVVGFEDVTEFVDESLDVGFEGEGRGRTGFGVVTSFDAGEKGFRHERKNEGPVIDQNLYYLGLKNTSATFASAVVNVLPALTFIMAIIFRLEKVNLKKIQSVAKVVGTVITVTGAMVMTLYKGAIVDILWYSKSGNHHHNTTNSTSTDQHWVMGTFMILACTCGWSGFFIVQSITLKQYPAELSLTASICLMGMVEGAAVALAMERDMSAWVVGFDSRLLAAVYSRVVCSGVAYYVQGVVNKVRGPVFITAFSPLCMIITAILGAIILAEKIHLGR
ncbi:unnamed protein product [Camellia sinensis]